MHAARHDLRLHAAVCSVEERDGGEEIGALAAKRAKLTHRRGMVAGLAEKPAIARRDLVGADDQCVTVGGTYRLRLELRQPQCRIGGLLAGKRALVG